MSMEHLDPVLVHKGKVIVLHRVAMELLGAIDEYVALPCDSLLKAMKVTADRYRQRALDNAPDSRRYEALEYQTQALFDEKTPIYIHAGKRLCKLLRENGAPEGQEALAVATFIYMRKFLTLEVELRKSHPDLTHQECHRLAVAEHKVNLHEAAEQTTEGQRVVHIIFSEGATPGKSLTWLRELIKDVRRLSDETAQLDIIREVN